MKGFIIMIDLKKMAKAGVQFGHLTSRWCPEMKPVIWGQKNNIHLIDLSKTAYELERASKFLEEIASTGKSILWVGTKKAAQNAIKQTAESLQQPYVDKKWVGGTLTNYSQVKKSVTKMLHYEDIVSKSAELQDSHYTKQELSRFSTKRDRWADKVGGIRTLTWPIAAIVIVDVKKEHVAVKEAVFAGIPIVAIVDTNSSPRNINYAIPGNDDAPRSVELLVSYLSEAVHRGQVVAAARPQEEIVAEQTVEQLLQQAFGAEEEDENARRRRGPRGSVGSSNANNSGPRSSGLRRPNSFNRNRQGSARQPEAKKADVSESNKNTSE